MLWFTCAGARVALFNDGHREPRIRDVPCSPGGAFREVATHYFGGPAYFLIYNSLVMRVPLSIKRYVAPPLFWAETAWNALPGKRPFPAACSSP